jgi:hypothetical protein
MQGWLDAFAALGLIRWDSDGSPAIMSSSGDAAT